MRKTDSSRRPHFRSSDRFFRHEEKWCFQARESVRGPFDSREAAEFELKRYLNQMGYLDGNEALPPSGVSWNDLTLVDIDKPS
jgi:hypothetical protein